MRVLGRPASSPQQGTHGEERRARRVLECDRVRRRQSPPAQVGCRALPRTQRSMREVFTTARFRKELSTFTERHLELAVDAQAALELIAKNPRSAQTVHALTRRRAVRLFRRAPLARLPHRFALEPDLSVFLRIGRVPCGSSRRNLGAWVSAPLSSCTGPPPTSTVMNHNRLRNDFSHLKSRSQQAPFRDGTCGCK
jgi:hypothetical protein